MVILQHISENCFLESKVEEGPDVQFLFLVLEKNYMLRTYLMIETIDTAENFRNTVKGKFHTILADPPWQFQNRTGKMAPEHKRLNRYPTLSLDEIKRIPIQDCLSDPAHLYLWVPNALLREGLEVMQAWGFSYKTNIVWYKIRKDGGPGGRVAADRGGRAGRWRPFSAVGSRGVWAFPCLDRSRGGVF